MKKFNIRHLVTVEVVDFSESSSYSYKNKRIFPYRREGIYIRTLDGFKYMWEVSDLVSHYNLILKDKKVMKKARVILTLSTIEIITYYFDSLQEAEQFFQDLTNFNTWHEFYV